MIQTYFHQLHKIICHHIADAKHNIYIAVSWFTHKDIFDALIKKMQLGIEVSLLIEYDTKNFSKNTQNIDFQHFIDSGGKLYVNQKAPIMHHKFMIVDNRQLLTGSYNWTYNTNAENLLKIEIPEVIADYKVEYDHQIITSKNLRKISYEGLKIFSTFPLFEESYFQLHDLRKKVANRIKTWYIVAGEEKLSAADATTTRLPLYYDSACDDFFSDYWMQHPQWDKVAFKQYLLENKHKLSPKTARMLHNTCISFTKGDIIILVNKACHLKALGIVQSEPRYNPELPSMHCTREVQWLEYAHQSIILDIPKQIVGRYKGSVLALLQAVYVV